MEEIANTLTQQVFVFKQIGRRVSEGQKDGKDFTQLLIEHTSYAMKTLAEQNCASRKTILIINYGNYL